MAEAHPSRLAAFFRIANVRLRFIVLMAAVGIVAAKWETIANYYDRWRRPLNFESAAAESNFEYFCPMHPSVVRGEPGNCPICGMPLSKREKSAAASARGVARVQLTPEKMALGGIATTPVQYRLLSREFRTVGTIDHDERCEARVSARIRGRIEKLWVNFVGQQVKRGDPLFSIYSPQLFVAQKELLSARQVIDQARARGASPEETFYQAARLKLSLWGIDDAQLDELVKRGTAENDMMYRSPISGIIVEKRILPGQYVAEGDSLYTIYDLSNVWIQARVFEDEIAGVKIGTVVEVKSTAHPNTIFAGRVTYVSYTVDPATRTVAARIEVPNPDYQLRPGMYATATIRMPVGRVTPLPGASQPATSEPATERDEHFAVGYYCPLHPDHVFDAPAICVLDNLPTLRARVETQLAVPAGAVIDTGTQKIVYRETSPGVFEMTGVQLAPRAGDYFPVVSGLTEGDRIASAGAFLVDAENRLNPSAAAQYFGATR